MTYDANSPYEAEETVFMSQPGMFEIQESYKNASASLTSYVTVNHPYPTIAREIDELPELAELYTKFDNAYVKYEDARDAFCVASVNEAVASGDSVRALWYGHKHEALKSNRRAFAAYRELRDSAVAPKSVANAKRSLFGRKKR